MMQLFKEDVEITTFLAFIYVFIFRFLSKTNNVFLQSGRRESPRTDSSEDSVIENEACVLRSTSRAKMAAAFNRDPSYEDNRSDIYDDDEDRGFFQLNESDEGMHSSSF